MIQFDESTQNVIVARFARIVEWDFFCDFQKRFWLHLRPFQKGLQASAF